PITDDAIGANWENAEELADCSVTDLSKTPEDGLGFGDLPAGAAKAKNYAAWSKTFATWIFRMQKIDLMKSPSLDQLSKPKQSEPDSGIRLQTAAREERDRQKAAMQSKYAPRLDQLQRRKMQAEQKRAAEKQQSTAAIFSSVVTAGAGILGAFMGRKTLSVT